MQPRICAKCASIPEDILLLVCNHHLCVDCAAFKIVASQKNIICEFCKQQTVLDSKSLSQLQKLRIVLEEKKNKSTIAKQKNEQPQNTEKQAPPILIIKKTCHLHREQQVHYYCFDCQCQCICPECIIHGVHRDHNVQTLKKSYPIVRAKLQNEQQRLNKNIGLITKKKNDIDNHKIKVKQQMDKQKKEIQKIFIEMKMGIDRKQKQVMQICDKILQQVFALYDNQNNQLNKKIQGIKTIIDQIHNADKKEEIKYYQVTLIDFYSKNKQFFKQVTRKMNLDNFLKPNTDKYFPIPIINQFRQKLSSQIFTFNFHEAYKKYELDLNKLQNKNDSTNNLQSNLNGKESPKKE